MQTHFENCFASYSGG
uniref:Uncharacterized protein n=1 Tax=Rhizophora mucronata TaxID=61149 RepID=A0A2P2MZQ0_RHIMU